MKSSKKISSLAFTTLIILYSTNLAFNTYAKPIPNSYIVQVNKTFDANYVAALSAQNTKGSIKHIYKHALKGFNIHLPPGLTKADLLKIPGVIKVEQDIEIKACAQTIPTGIRRINIPQNGFAKIDGIDERIDVNIAIIDSGIDPTHPDLNINASGSRNFVPGNPSKWDDGDGHGTHVSGIAAALDNSIGVVGLAPGARLWALRVLNNTGTGSIADSIDAIDYATAHANEIQVANMSFSAVGKIDSLRTAIANSVAAGIVYVAAAGNESVDIYGADGIFNTSDDTIPAAYPEVLTVSALADSDGSPGGLGSSTSYGPDDSFATLSNYSQSVTASNPVSSPGAAIDLMMPGISIYSTYKNNSYTTLSGTSMASPHAAGLVALYIAANGQANNAAEVYAIRQTLINASVNQNDYRGLAVLNDADSSNEGIGYFIRSDFNYDSLVDYEDMYELTLFWLADDALTDISPLGGDGIVNFFDYCLFASDWMK